MFALLFPPLLYLRPVTPVILLRILFIWDPLQRWMSLSESLSDDHLDNGGCQTGRSQSRGWPQHGGRTQSSAALPSLSSSLIKLPRSDAVRYMY